MNSVQDKIAKNLAKLQEWQASEKVCLQCSAKATKKETVGIATAYFCKEHNYKTFRSFRVVE